MRLTDMDRYNLPKQIMDKWLTRQGECLLPIQRHAIRKGLLESCYDPDSSVGSNNMIISGPTSSGKSFCAEMAVAMMISMRRKSVLLFPLRSLAEEKHKLFCQTYQSLGINPLLITGDYPENDRAFLNGDYRVAIVINEKFDLLLSSRLDLLSSIGLVVVDELQMITEPERGAVLERLLTKILASRYNPQIIALSAVLADRTVSPLANWLNATVVEETQRPRELIRGIAAEGRLRYRSYNDSRDGVELWSENETTNQPDELSELPDPVCFGGDGNIFSSLIRQLKIDTGATLIFLKSRADSVNMAVRLAALLSLSSAEKALAKLSGEESSHLLGALARVLRHGVGFHNSDLSSFQRQVVQEAFMEGEISILCCTSTLALGVNLPADNVYLETVKYASGHYNGKPTLVPISRAEFDNISGRASRYGIGSAKPGRAVVLAETTLDQDILWDRYILPDEPQVINSALLSLPLEDWLLHMAATGLVSTEHEVNQLTQKTFWAGCNPEGRLSWEIALARLVELKLIRKGERGKRLMISPSGKAAVSSGLSVNEADWFSQALVSDLPESPFGWTCLSLSSPDWQLPPAVLNWYEQAENRPVKMLYQRFDYSVEEALSLLPENHRREPLPYRIAASLKSALLLDEYCRLVPLRSLEESYGMHLGQIQSVGRTAAHLVGGLSRLLAATDCESPSIPMLRDHAFSLRFGLPPVFKQMHSLLGRGINRSDFGAIYKAGIETAMELAELSEKELGELFNNTDKARNINQLLKTYKEEVDMQPAVFEPELQPCSQPNRLEIDGSFEDDRYLIKINGFPVRLTGKSFKYLVKLAWSRLKEESGWIYKEDIEVGFNQARYLYRMKNEINAGFRSGWSIIENNRLGYYRLHVDPEKIHLNLENLKRHPDYELRQIVSSESGLGAVN